MSGEPSRQLLDGTLVRPDATQFADDESTHGRSAAFDVVVGYSVVSNLCGGERQDLPGVARVCESFLVAAHRRVENDLAEVEDGTSRRTEPSARKDGSVGENEPCSGVRRDVPDALS